MKKWLIGSIGIIIVLLMWFGGNIYEAVRDTPSGNLITEANEGNFKVTFESKKETYSAGEEIQVWTTIQYNGLKPFTKIYHASSIFYISINGIDNDFQQGSVVFLVMKPSYLFRNVSVIEDFFNGIELQSDKYKITATASFSETQTNNNIEIPVNLVIEVTE